MGPCAAPKEREAAARWMAAAIAMVAVRRIASVREMVWSARVMARPVRLSS